jgi:hypothetical protein
LRKIPQQASAKLPVVSVGKQIVQRTHRYHPTKKLYAVALKKSLAHSMAQRESTIHSTQMHETQYITHDEEGHFRTVRLGGTALVAELKASDFQIAEGAAARDTSLAMGIPVSPRFFGLPWLKWQADGFREFRFRVFRLRYVNAVNDFVTGQLQLSFQSDPYWFPDVFPTFSLVKEFMSGQSVIGPYNRPLHLDMLFNDKIKWYSVHEAEEALSCFQGTAWVGGVQRPSTQAAGSSDDLDPTVAMGLVFVDWDIELRVPFVGNIPSAYSYTGYWHWTIDGSYGEPGQPVMAARDSNAADDLQCFVCPTLLSNVVVGEEHVGVCIVDTNAGIGAGSVYICNSLGETARFLSSTTNTTGFVFGFRTYWLAGPETVVLGKLYHGDPSTKPLRLKTGEEPPSQIQRRFPPFHEIVQMFRGNREVHPLVAQAIQGYEHENGPFRPLALDQDPPTCVMVLYNRLPDSLGEAGTGNGVSLDATGHEWWLAYGSTEGDWSDADLNFRIYGCEVSA